MGFIHKLRPEVRDFILEQKKTTPSLSCRDLTSLILEQFHINVSKSSINAIFKENNLSMPIGRRQKLKKKKFNMPVLPIIEGIKAITLVAQPSRAVVNSSLRGAEGDEANTKNEIASAPTAHRNDKNDTELPKADETAKEEPRLEEKRVKEAEIWAIKLLEDEHNRLEGTITKYTTTCHSDPERNAKGKNLDEAEILRSAAACPERSRRGLPQDDKTGISQQSLSLEQEKPDRECTGVVLLKAIDYLVRGSAQLSEAIQRRLGSPKEEVEAFTQALIFQGILGNTPGALSSVPRDEINADKLSAYLVQLRELESMKLDLSRLAENIWTEVRGMKMHFIDGNIVYLDAQMRTVWPTPYIPYDFSATITTVKDSVHRYFFKDGNLVLFMAPGYDVPTKEFFTLLLNFNSKDKTADNLILYGNKLDELENIALDPEEGRNLLFALWPWQWTAYRKVQRIGEFSLHHIDCVDKDFYLAEIEIELIEPTARRSSALKGCAIKLNLAEKIRLVVLSTDEAKSLVSLADSYLCRWPNLDEGFHDFSRKIELFNYLGESQQSFAYADLPMALASGSQTIVLQPIGKSEPADLKSIFSGYAEALDAYLRRHFMPSGYDKIEFSLTKGRFYNQKAQLIQAKGKMRCFLTVAHDYAYAKDLEYICHRLNERDIRADNGQRIYFESGFK